MLIGLVYIGSIRLGDRTIWSMSGGLRNMDVRYVSYPPFVNVTVSEFQPPNSSNNPAA